MYCPQCGTQTGEEARFCHSCGIKLPEIKRKEPSDLYNLIDASLHQKPRAKVEQTSEQSSQNVQTPLAHSPRHTNSSYKTNSYIIYFLGAGALFIAVLLDKSGGTISIVTFVAKLLSYSLILGIPTVLIAKYGSKTPLLRAARVFSWLFLAASLFDYLPLLERLAYSGTSPTVHRNQIESTTPLNVPQEVSVINQTLQDPSDNQNGWTTIAIKGIGTIDIPPTMEIQAGKYKEFADAYRKIKGYETSDLVIQPKGASNLERDAIRKYARVLISKRVDSESIGIGLHFSFADFTRKDVSELNEVFTAQIKSQLPPSTTVTEWYPLELVKVNRMSSMRLGFKRQLRDNPPVVVYSYKFFDYTKTYELTVSYRETEKSYWKKDLERLVNSFVIEEQ